MRSAPLLCCLLLAPVACTQQVPDTLFKAPIAKPLHPIGQGPVVTLDEGHYNFHTLAGRYRAFATVLRADGYTVVANHSVFDSTAQIGRAHV